MLRGESLTRRDLCRSRSIALLVKMPNLLPQRALHEGLSHGSCCSGSRNTYAKCCDIPDDEAGDEQIDEVEDEVVDVARELLRVAPTGGIVVQRSCR